jgi:hypothetical protein
VAGSRQFAKASQLQEILLYVCQRALADPGTSVKEYEIGCHAMGRRADFNPNLDNIVRVQMSHLRKKLDEYASTDGKSDTLRIVLPKRTYVPIFEEVTPAPEPAPPGIDGGLAQDAPEIHGDARLPRRTMVALVLLGMAIGALLTAAILGRRISGGRAVDPVFLEAWRPFAKPGANVLLSSATPLNMVTVPEGHTTYGSQTYPVPPEAYTWFRQHRLLAPGAKLSMYFTDNMLGVGNMNAVVTVSNTLRAMGSTFETLPERVATLAALRGRNTMLFGSPFHSEAITRLMENTPLIVDYNTGLKEFVVRDRTTGQFLAPIKDANGDFSQSYGLVTVLNTRDSERGKLGMVIFTGITSAGTHGAAEYFSSPTALRNLKQIFMREGLKGFPPAYQVIVKCTFSDILLQSYAYLAHRILQRE